MNVEIGQITEATRQKRPYVLLALVCLFFCFYFWWSVTPAAGGSESSDGGAVLRTNNEMQAGEDDVEALDALDVLLNRSRETKQKLRQSSIAMPKTPTDEKGKAELQKVIEQVESIQFVDLPKTKSAAKSSLLLSDAEEKSDSTTAAEGEVDEGSAAQSSAPPVSEASQEPLESRAPQVSRSASEVSRGQDVTVGSLGLRGKPLSTETLNKLKALSEDANQIYNPAAVAQTLFITGNRAEAARFYRIAFERLAAQDANKGVQQSRLSANERFPDLDEERTWILLQIGNCLRKDDAEAACKAYRELVLEYPKSLWCDLAMAEEQLIEWRRRNKGLALLEKAK